MHRLVIILFFLAAPGIYVFSGENRPEIPVIIDTDGAPDDQRAIAMLSAIREIDILGIITSDGAVDPLDGHTRVRELLHYFGRADIETGMGTSPGTDPPPWREFCTSVPWVPPTGIETEPGITAAGLLVSLLRGADEPVILVCLGGLTNISALLSTAPELKEKIRKIIWYNEGAGPVPETNYALDPVSAGEVLASGLSVDIVSNLGREDARWTTGMIHALEKMETIQAEAVLAAFNSPAMNAEGSGAGVVIWDELLPVYLMYPRLFSMQPRRENPRVSVATDYHPEGVRSRILEILSGNYPVENNIVFDVFPDDPGLYALDVRALMNGILERHGKEEWRLAVLTNELHGHLGIYSIVGVKMGLRARELLGAERDALSVVSFAGNLPPLSCLNDGLQVSTGATLGMGTIRVEEGEEVFAGAVFTSGGRSIELRLKEAYLKQVESDISLGILQYGDLTEGYWKLIRDLGLKYWSGWNRTEIFDVREID